MAARKSHDATGRLVYASREDICRCERCKLYMSVVDILDRRVRTGYCFCGGIVEVLRGK